MSNCEHKWLVYSTALADCVLMLRCEKCDARGVVDNPTQEEWRKAYHAPSAPYLWENASRVRICGKTLADQVKALNLRLDYLMHESADLFLAGEIMILTYIWCAINNKFSWTGANVEPFFGQIEDIEAAIEMRKGRLKLLEEKLDAAERG